VNEIRRPTYQIYALVKNNVIFYVGCTRRLKNRLSDHRGFKRDFDEVRILDETQDVNKAGLIEVMYQEKYLGRSDKQLYVEVCTVLPVEKRPRLRSPRTLKQWRLLEDGSWLEETWEQDEN
jgi:predicted GIY-YIG superfamily endonuclease